MTLETPSPPTLPGFTPVPTPPAPGVAPSQAPALRWINASLPDTGESLLDEIKRDWYPLLDPRNWDDNGPTDIAILARYQAIDTNTHETWPNVSGSRMYSLVWPALRRTHQVPEQRFLKVCRDTRDHNLPQALAHFRDSALAYSVQSELLGQQLWNGDSFGAYRALAHFAGVLTEPIEALIKQALATALTRALAQFFSALADRYRPQDTPRRRKPKSRPDTPAWIQDRDQARAAITRFRRLQQSPDTTRLLLTEATIGPRFADARWPTLETGQPLPPDLVAALMDPTFVPRALPSPASLDGQDPNTDLL